MAWSVGHSSFSVKMLKRLSNWSTPLNILLTIGETLSRMTNHSGDCRFEESSYILITALQIITNSFMILQSMAISLYSTRPLSPKSEVRETRSIGSCTCVSWRSSIPLELGPQMCGQIIKWLMSSISFQHALAFIKRVLDVPAENNQQVQAGHVFIVWLCRWGLFNVIQCLSMSLQTGGTPKSSKYLSIEIHGHLGIHADPSKNLRIFTQHPEVATRRRRHRLPTKPLR